MSDPSTIEAPVTPAPAAEKKVIRRRKLEDLVQAIGEKFFEKERPETKLTFNVEVIDGGASYETSIVAQDMTLVAAGKGPTVAAALVDTLRALVDEEDDDAQAVRELEAKLAEARKKKASKHNVLSSWKGYGSAGSKDESADEGDAEGK